jgi:hypothetical protein
MTNLMPYSDFEGSVVPSTYSTLPTFDTAHFLSGTRALKLALAAATGYWTDGDGTNSARWVTGTTSGNSYTLSIWVYADAAMQVRVNIEWANLAHNASISTSSGTYTSATVGGWLRLVTTATAPVGSGSMNAAIEVQSAASGRNAWFDEMQFETGSSATTWAPGPNDPAGKAEAGTTAAVFVTAGTVIRRKAAAGTATAAMSAGGTVRRARPEAGTAAFAATVSGVPKKLRIVGGATAVTVAASAAVTNRKKPAGSGQIVAAAVATGRSTVTVL